MLGEQGMDALDCLRAWTEFASLDLADRTVKHYRYWLTRYQAEAVDPRYGLNDLPEATTDNLISFMAIWAKHGRPASQARSALRHFFRWMQRTGRRADDPTDGLPRARKLNSLPDFLDREQLTRLLIAATQHNEEWGWSLLFIFGTGGRISEACGVEWRDLMLELGVVRFRQTKGQRDEDVHLGPSARAAAEWLVEHRNGHDTVLGVTPAAIRARMRKAAEWAGLPKGIAHPHALRHSAASVLAENGASGREIQDFLRHVDPRMTDHYTHVFSKRAREVADLL